MKADHSNQACLNLNGLISDYLTNAVTAIETSESEFLWPARSNEEFQRKIGSFKSSMLEFEWFDFRLSDECRDSLRNEHSEFLRPARSNEENIGMYFICHSKNERNVRNGIY